MATLLEPVAKISTCKCLGERDDQNAKNLKR